MQTAVRENIAALTRETMPACPGVGFCHDIIGPSSTNGAWPFTTVSYILARTTLQEPGGHPTPHPQRQPRARTDGRGVGVAVGALERPRDARGAGDVGQAADGRVGCTNFFCFSTPNRFPALLVPGAVMGARVPRTIAILHVVLVVLLSP